MSTEYYDCFLSYRSADAAIAAQIHGRLTAAGFKVWWDKVYLQPEMRWHAEIERHCEASRIVIPLLTPEWKDSLWTRYETYGADRVVPLLLRGTWEQAVTPPLSVLQSDLVVYSSATAAEWKKLFRRLRQYRDEPRPVQGEKGRPTLLKHRPIDHFVGRDQTMVDLHEKLFLNRQTALTQGTVIAIPALGGVGKTTLARHYAKSSGAATARCSGWIAASAWPLASPASMISCTLARRLACRSTSARRARRRRETPCEPRSESAG